MRESVVGGGVGGKRRRAIKRVCCPDQRVPSLVSIEKNHGHCSIYFTLDILWILFTVVAFFALDDKVKHQTSQECLVMAIYTGITSLSVGRFTSLIKASRGGATCGAGPSPTSSWSTEPSSSSHTQRITVSLLVLAKPLSDLA